MNKIILCCPKCNEYGLVDAPLIMIAGHRDFQCPNCEQLWDVSTEFHPYIISQSMAGDNAALEDNSHAC